MAVEDEHNALVDALVGLGICVFTLNPKQVDRFRDREGPSGAKDDRSDARVLASTVRTDLGCFRRVSPPSDLAVHLKAINRAIEALNQDFRRTANRTRASVLYTTIFVKGALAADELEPDEENFDERSDRITVQQEATERIFLAGGSILKN